MDPPWQTAYQQSIGVAHREPHRIDAMKSERVAGMSTASCAYVNAANDFPRFERQIIRTVQDGDIQSGAKQPHPELLRQYPTREFSHGSLAQGGTRDFNRTQLRPGSGRSGRSAVSGRSGRSDASRRSIASSAGRSLVTPSSAAPPPGYHRQVPVADNVFQTTSSAIGGGGRIAREVSVGREVWGLGRGGGQQTSFDSCLFNKGRHVPP